MKPIIAPINASSTPDVVGNLQDAIVYLLQSSAITLGEADRSAIQAGVETERASGHFGHATIKAVSVLQDLLHLHQTGVVDESTATAVNSLLKGAGAFEDAAPRAAIVSGRVRGADGLPLADVQVRAFHEAATAPVKLGEDRTDAEGRYTIRYDAVPGVRTVLLRVVASRDTETLASSAVARTDAVLAAVDLVVPITQPTTASRRIEGRVVYEYGLPAVGLTLRLYRHTFGADAPVHVRDAPTEELGVYKFVYDADPVSNSLEIRAVDSAGTEVRLTEVVHGLGGEEGAVLNLVAPASLKPLETEFARMAADLAPHVADMKALGAAVETEKRQDLTLLNTATNWDARLLALASKAASVSEEPNVGLSQSVLYGLFRAGLPSDSQQLAQVSADTVSAALDKVTQAGIVALSPQDVTDAKTAFGQLQQNVQLSARVPGSSATYNGLLAAADLSQGAREKFVDVYVKHQGSALGQVKAPEPTSRRPPIHSAPVTCGARNATSPGVSTVASFAPITSQSNAASSHDFGLAVTTR